MYTVELHLVVTSLLRPLFLSARLNDPTFPWKKKTLVKTATPLIPPSFFDPLVNGFPLYQYKGSFVLSLALKQRPRCNSEMAYSVCNRTSD